MAQAVDPHSTFDPLAQTHFAISEAGEFRLRQVRDAMLTVSDLLDGTNLEDQIEITGERLASLVRALSYGIARVHAEGLFTFPSSQLVATARVDERAI